MASRRASARIPPWDDAGLFQPRQSVRVDRARRNPSGQSLAAHQRFEAARPLDLSGGKAMASADLALLVFAVCNSLRIAAYVPQILRLAPDEGGAGAVSPTTWGLFALANVSTVLYAALVAADLSLALVFCQA